MILKLFTSSTALTTLGTSTAIGLIARTSPLTLFTISGHSMLPNFKPGEKVICFNWAYFFVAPKVGEEVVARVKGKNFINRITKIAGDKYILSGDNSKDSLKLGVVERAQIVGKVVKRI